MTTPLNVFVTGGTSPLGRETTRQLVARGHKVTALTQGSAGAVQVRQDGGLPTYSDPFRAGELKSLLKMAQADVVLHLMPQIANTFPHRESPWTENARILKECTDAVLEASAAQGVKFIVFPSYSAVYGDTHGEWVTEESKLHGSDFPAGAVSAEKRVLGGTVPACVLRAGFIYGAGDSGTDALRDSLRDERPVYLGDSHSVHSWVQVADLAHAVVLAAEQQPAGQIFNIVDDEPASAAAFANQLAAGLGLVPPTPLTGFMATRQTNETQRALLDRSARVKNDKAKQSLGWTPRNPTLKTGIEQTLLYWRAEPA